MTATIETTAATTARPETEHGQRPETLARASVVIAATLAGLSAGFFYTYQISVVRALAEVDSEAYVPVFQAINETVRNGWFAVAFFGSVPVILAALVLNRRAAGPARFLIGAAFACHAATIMVTGSGNMPLNDELATYVEPSPATIDAVRSDFEEPWNDFNRIRAITSFGAFVLLVGAVATSRSRPSAPPR